MSLAQITEKIENDARKEAEQILGRAKEQAAAIEKRAKEEISQIAETNKTKFDKERPEIARRREIVAQLDVNKLELGARRNLISDVYAKALEKFCELPKDKYLAFCEKLLVSAKESGDETMRISASEKYIDAAWLDDFNARNGSHIKLSGDKLPISGGFVLNKGRIRVNCSWDMLVQVAQEKSETEVVKRLFQA